MSKIAHRVEKWSTDICNDDHVSGPAYQSMDVNAVQVEGLILEKSLR
jgi:hypothetical protein